MQVIYQPAVGRFTDASNLSTGCRGLTQAHTKYLIIFENILI
jgi:hypothetical protein